MALFSCVLLHELAHSKVAIHFKFPIKRITLFCIGGVAEFGGDFREEGFLSAKTELCIAIAGPGLNLALAGLFFIGASLVTGIPILYFALYGLAFLNVLMAVFNLLPAFPMDGGRVLRAFLWMKSNNLVKATRIAYNFGVVSGLIFIIIGMVTLNIILGIIGLFVILAGREEYRQVATRESLKKLKGIKLKDLIKETGIVPINPNQEEIYCSLEEDILEIIKKMEKFKTGSLWIKEGDRILGIVTVEKINEYLKKKEMAQ